MPINITFIGLCRPAATGVGVWSYIITNDNTVLHQAAGIAGNNTNSYAANLTGLLEACRWLNQQQSPGDAVLYGNNLTVLKQVRDQWKLKVPMAKLVVPEIKKMLEGRTVQAGLRTPNEMKAVRKLAESQYQGHHA